MSEQFIFGVTLLLIGFCLGGFAVLTFVARAWPKPTRVSTLVRESLRARADEAANARKVRQLFPRNR